MPRCQGSVVLSTGLFRVRQTIVPAMLGVSCLAAFFAVGFRPARVSSRYLRSSTSRSIGGTPATSCSATVDTVRYVEITLSRDFLCVLSIKLRYFVIFMAACHTGAAYSSMEWTTQHSTRLLLLLGPPTFGMTCQGHSPLLLFFRGSLDVGSKNTLIVQDNS